MSGKFVQYYVEGENEKKLLAVLKADLMVIRPGKVQIFNAVQDELTRAHLTILRPKTMVVLVFDTDTGNTGILCQNIKMLEQCSFVSEVITITQVPNLEQELVRSCDIKQITELLDSKSFKDFKRDFNRTTNLSDKLRQHHFNIERFWSTPPPSPYQNIVNQAEKIKLLYGHRSQIY